MNDNLIKTLMKFPTFSALQGADKSQIDDAEKKLNLSFAEEYRTYVAAYGAVTANAHELTGICAFPRLDVVSVTQEERMRNPSVPADWYVIEQANIDDIVIWQDASGAVYQTMPGIAPQKICESLSEYVNL